MKKTHVILLGGILMLAAVAVIAEQPYITQDVLYFHSNFKTVKFTHKDHADLAQYGINSDCTKCHPPYEQKYDDAVSIKDLAHGHCKNCHQASQADHPNAPVKCAGCHTGQEPPNQ